MSRDDEVWKCELRASQVLQALKMTSLPVDPFKVAESHGITCCENPSLQAGMSGCLMKSGDHFGIIYSCRFASEGFKRFTVAHELGHYFLEGHIPGLFAGDRMSHTSDSGFISADHYEREADYFAAGLLMPNELFARACNNAGRDLPAIEKLAALCQTSLTATAIRFAGVTEDAVAVVCSKADRILYCFMSKRLRGVRGLTWPKKGSGLPSDTATAKFNRNLENVLLGKRLTSTSNLGMWFDGLPEVVVGEDVVGLGEYGRTLTVLTTSDLPDGGDEAKVVEDEEDLENMLPSDRWRALDKRRRRAR